MKTFISLLVLSLAIGLAVTELRYRGNAVNPDYPNQCYYEELKQPIPINQSFTPLNQKGICQRLFCRSDFVLLLESCNRHNLISNATCTIQADYSKPYPLCCDELVCQNDINLV